MKQRTSAPPDARTMADVCLIVLADGGYLFLQSMPLFLGLLQLSLKLSDLRNVTGGLRRRQRFDLKMDDDVCTSGEDKVKRQVSINT